MTHELFLHELIQYINSTHLQVISVINEDWLEGKFGDDTGIFPKSHCVHLELQKSSRPFGVRFYMYAHKYKIMHEISMTV